MDFITCLRSSKRRSTIMTVVARLIKYGHVIPLASTFTANTIAEAFVTQIICFHGPPRSIVTDRDPRSFLWYHVSHLTHLVLGVMIV